MKVISKLKNILSMRPHNSSVIIVGQIQNGKHSSRSANCYLRGIIRQSQTGYNPVIVSFQDVLAEVHLPNSQQLILSSRYAEPWTNHQTADGWVVMQFVDFLKLVSRIVDLEQQTILAAHIDFLDLGSLPQGVGIVIEIFEVQNSEDCVASMMVKNYRRTW